MNNFNKFALIAGCLLLTVSLILLIKMEKMNDQLDALLKEETYLIEELQKYEEEP